MNKHYLFLAALLSLLISVPAAALDARHCESQANRKQGAERDNFLKSCLAELSTPAHVQEVAQQNKKATCEQNAKNKGLSSSHKGEYVNECVSKNEAAEAAKEAAAKAPAQAATTTAATESKPRKSQQAAAKSTSSKKQHKKHKSAS